MTKVNKRQTVAKAGLATKPVSLTWLKFLYRNARDPLLLWHSEVAHTYAERWVRQNVLPGVESGKLLHETEATRSSAFVRSSTTIGQFIDRLPQIERRLRLDTIVRLVTTFETYLFDTIRRAIFLHPSIVKDVNAQFTVADIVASQSVDTDMRDWLARSVADRWIRGGDHEEKIKKVDTLVKAGMFKRMSDEINQWVRWTLVRNTITHLDGDVSDELAAKWPERFSSRTSAIEIVDEDVIKVAELSRVIAESIDSRFVGDLVRQHDAELLAAECFVRWGIDDPRVLSVVASQMLSVQFTRNEAVALLAQFKSGTSAYWASREHGLTFSVELLQRIESKLVSVQKALPGKGGA